jgi:hypothetical protein
MIDNVFTVEDFVTVMNRAKAKQEDVRLAIRRQQLGEITLSVEIWITVGAKEKIIRCMVDKKLFNTFELSMAGENPTKKSYEDFVNRSLSTIEASLGFKPLEGWWE